MMSENKITPGSSKYDLIKALELAVVIMKATRELLDLQNQSSYVLNLLEETVNYDDTECDGNCLMMDAKDAINIAEAAIAKAKGEPNENHD